MKKFICLAITGLVLGGFFAGDTKADEQKFCFTKISFPLDSNNPATWYEIYIDRSFFKYVFSTDYPSKEEAAKAAISIAEQLDAQGVCKYIRGWVHP